MGSEAEKMIKESRVDSGEFVPGPHFSEQIGKILAQQILEHGGRIGSLEIPMNEQVRSSVEYFLTDARKFMIRSLGRSNRYRAVMERILREKGLPPELVWLVLIESGFRVGAVSPAAAVGPWQFIAPTGRRYGLEINEWVDERQHPVKATYAAAAYLTDLYAMFGDWNLALAGYNCGEAKVQKGLRRFGVTNFWALSSCSFLRAETKDYVPKFLAAVVIASDPERYGLNGISPEPLEVWDEVAVTQPTDLSVIARLTGAGEEEIKALNPHLKLWCTPVEQSPVRGAGAQRGRPGISTASMPR